MPTKPPLSSRLNRQHPLSRHLVAGWFFNEGAGTRLFDATGRHHGTLSNGPAWVADRDGAALSFDGVDDLVAVPFSNRLANLTEMTVLLRCKFTSGALQMMVGFGDNSTTGFQIGVNINGTHRLEFATGGNFQMGPTNVAIDDGVWHTHIVTLKGGTAGQFYLDGVDMGARTYTAPAPHSGNRYIGVFNNGSAFPFNGRISTFQIFDRALTVSEVRQLTADPFRLLRKPEDIIGKVVTATGDTFTIAVTQTAHTTALTALETFIASGAVTQSAHTTAIASLETFLSSAAVTQSAHTTSTNALETFLAAGAVTQTGHTSAIAAKETFLATGAVTQSAHTTTISALESFVGPIGVVQSPHSTSIIAAYSFSFLGAIAVVQAGHTITMSGTVDNPVGSVVTGVFAVTQTAHSGLVRAVNYGFPATPAPASFGPRIIRYHGKRS